MLLDRPTRYVGVSRRVVVCLDKKANAKNLRDSEIRPCQQLLPQGLSDVNQPEIPYHFFSQAGRPEY